VLCNFVDTGHGGALVARFNTIKNSYFEQHSTHGGRGSKNLEVYHNTMSLGPTFQPNFSRPFFLQGAGTGIIFENHSSQNYSVRAINFSYERDEDGDSRWGSCNGSNNVDGNESPPGNGWPCRDQMGVSHDVSLYNGSGTAPAQIKAPWYSWNNDQPNGPYPWAGNDSSSTSHTKECRDFYGSTSSCAGAAGVRIGTKAQMLAATCSSNPLGSAQGVAGKGPGFWVTDEGDWDSTNPGPDGRLYVCTAANTWTAYYTPYTYPHPLQTASGGGGGDTTPPTAPTNLRIQ
jgi:hypothetical protein